MIWSYPKSYEFIFSSPFSQVFDDVSDVPYGLMLLEKLLDFDLKHLGIDSDTELQEAQNRFESDLRTELPKY